MSYKFSLNGYMHNIHHGDWFGGKLVGLVTIKYHNININLYVTHVINLILYNIASNLNIY